MYAYVRESKKILTTCDQWLEYSGLLYVLQCDDTVLSRNWNLSESNLLVFIASFFYHALSEDEIWLKEEQILHLLFSRPTDTHGRFKVGSPVCGQVQKLPGPRNQHRAGVDIPPTLSFMVQ